jgi:hypothetical protein
MEERWTKWHSFQSSRHGNFVEAPVGAGIFEIRRTSDHVTVALSCTANLAHTLSAFVMRGKEERRFIFMRQRSPYAPGELEYRFWRTLSLSEAKIALELMHERSPPFAAT